MQDTSVGPKLEDSDSLSVDSGLLLEVSDSLLEESGPLMKVSDPVFRGSDTLLEDSESYPTFATVPATSFSCAGRKRGYYADILAGCQVRVAPSVSQGEFAGL